MRPPMEDRIRILTYLNTVGVTVDRRHLLKPGPTVWKSLAGDPGVDSEHV